MHFTLDLFEEFIPVGGRFTEAIFEGAIYVHNLKKRVNVVNLTLLGSDIFDASRIAAG